MGKTTIVLSRKTHDALQSLGRKGETFDELVMELVKQRIMNSRAGSRTVNKRKATVANQEEPSAFAAAASASLPTEEEEEDG